jgi:uncharacterized protein YcfL
MMMGLAWGELAGWGGYGSAPMAYNYGSTVCYQDDGVYVQGTRVGTAEEYAQQASAIASQGGADAKIAADDQWRALGVFALARSEETNPSTFLSLAIDKNGLLRGTYYDAVSDSTQNITGKVDKKTQKAAWTIGDKKTPVYEAGLTNLLGQQTTILVHRDDGKAGDGKVEQMVLVRVDDKAGNKIAQVTLRNVGQSTRSIKYRFDWFDQQGSRVSPGSAPWRELEVDAGDSKEIVSPGGTHGFDFRFSIRSN